MCYKIVKKKHKIFQSYFQTIISLKLKSFKQLKLHNNKDNFLLCEI